MKRICIGIPCYQDVSAETLEDYMRFAYYCGRRLPEFEFMIAIKSKSEQFRARNAITEAALQTACDYLFFLDDDHVIDWEETPIANSRYGMIKSFIEHLESDPMNGIIGALYYQRGAECKPVLMKEGKDGGNYWMREDEILNQVQEVSVQGGGCMMLKISMFDKIKGPWFEPETTAGHGTDLQICGKARANGFKVHCDTAVKIGHVQSKREVITPQNRHRVAIDNAQQQSNGDDGIDKQWKMRSALLLYRQDAEEYLKIPFMDFIGIAERYNAVDIMDNMDDLKKYYATRGKEQLARQVLFHHLPNTVEQMESFFNMINTMVYARGLDFGCGSAPIGFELALRGHHIDFVDIDGAGAYEFTKWRVAKRGLSDKCGFKLTGPYDYALMLDSIEHLQDLEETLTAVCNSLKPDGALITNYWSNNDYDNPEHVSMDKIKVKDILMKNGVYPMSGITWVKRDLGVMDRMEMNHESHDVA